LSDNVAVEESGAVFFVGINNHGIKQYLQQEQTRNKRTFNFVFDELRIENDKKFNRIFKWDAVIKLCKRDAIVQRGQIENSR
jgi:5-methylcytosine-specific restriction endonuclease McrBC GTP-binding regulatory subunit McrB